MKEWNYPQVYKWAVMYSRIYRNGLMEVEDAIQEMLLVALENRDKKLGYQRRAMKFHYLDKLRHEYIVKEYHLPLPEEDIFFYCDENKWDARTLVNKLIKESAPYQRQVYQGLLSGMSISEVSRTLGMSRVTVYRYLEDARVRLG